MKRPWASLGETTSLLVKGGRDQTIAPIIRGSYIPHGQNHGRTVYKRCDQAPNQKKFSVFCYFWDDRDGPNFSGWWFAPEIGGEQIWGFNPTALEHPPSAGWQVPFGAPIDMSLEVSVTRQQAGGNQQQPPHQWAPHAQQQQQVVSHRPGGESQQNLQGATAIRSALQRLSAATPETIDHLVENVRQVVNAEAYKGGPAQEASLRNEVAKQVLRAKNRVELVRRSASQGYAPGPSMRLDAKPEVIRNVARASPVTIEPPALGTLVPPTAKAAPSRSAAPSAGTTSLRPEGGAKQRRLTTDVTTGNRGAAPAKLEVVRPPRIIPHQLTSEHARQWLKWRLAQLEGKYIQSRREVGMQAVKLWQDQAEVKAMVGDDGVPWSVREVEVVEEAVAEASGLSFLHTDAPSADVARCSVDAVRGPLAVFIQQYGLVVALPAEDASATAKTSSDGTPKSESVTVTVVGPDEIAQSAAAVLWARFKQGEETAVVLLAGLLSDMSGMMASDFRQDLATFIEEFKVEVHESAEAIWLSGENADSLNSARKTLCQMLQFYMPEDFLLWGSSEDGTYQRLDAAVMDKLREDAELRHLTKRSTGDCAIDFDTKEGLLWICGRGCRSRAGARVAELMKANEDGPGNK